MKPTIPIHGRASLLLACVCAVAGCANKPNAANIDLRKQNQSLAAEVADLTRQRETDAATIQSLEQKQGTLRTLPADRLARLFTVSGIRLNRLTGGADLDPTRTGDEAVKIYLVPTDQTGDELKAAGSVVAEAFDLANPENTRIGRWEFGVDDVRAAWVGSALLYEYILTCPLDRPVQHEQITLKVTFTDELTRRVFTTQQVIHVKPG